MKWTVSNIKDAKYVGELEFQSLDNEWHIFIVLRTKDRLVFGGYTNTGFLESGYLDISDGFLSLVEYLNQLLENLELYYTGQTDNLDIIYNDRM